MLFIGGLRCAACVLSAERVLKAQPGVSHVAINAASQRARVVFDDRRGDLDDILSALGRAGFEPKPLNARTLDDSRRDEARSYRKRLLVAGFGAMQAMMFAMVLYVGAVDPMNDATRELFRWLGFLIATPVVFYSAAPFFAGARRSLRERRLGMDVPVVLAISLVYGASLAAALGRGGEVYFDSVSMFVFFLLTGRYLEMRARHRALDLGDALARLMPEFAQRRIAGDRLESVSVDDLVAGDVVHVDSGAIMPVDGTVRDNACRVDESMLTGESDSRLRVPGDVVLAGSLVIDGPVDVDVERTGAGTALAGIVSLVERARAERPRLARAGERIVAHFVIMVLSLAALTALAWSVVDPASRFDAVVAVLVVSCPCAFALAVPAAITRSLAVLARQGVLVVKPDAIESLAAASHVVLDKTGTLTDGLVVSQVIAADPPAMPGDRRDPAHARERALGIAAALARESRHPVSRAIVSAAGNAPLPRATEVRSHPGLGVEGRLGDRRFRLGRERFALGNDERDLADGDVVLSDGNEAIAVFMLDERLKPSAPVAIAALERQGLGVEIASGDKPGRVADVAARLGVRHWQGGMMPADKLERLRALRAAGARVVAVGDGVNDAPILAGADIAVAIAEGTDLARATSDIVLTSDRLEWLAEARSLAIETLAVVRQNQRWALLYNALAIPLAACGLVPPWLAAIGMSTSSLMVVMNALRIGRRQRQGAGTRSEAVAV